MSPYQGGVPHCKRCQAELGGDEAVCPQCHYEPKEVGLRITAISFVAVIVLMTVSLLSSFASPMLGLAFMLIAGIVFVGTFVAFVLAMAATPHRFGRVFKRF